MEEEISKKHKTYGYGLWSRTFLDSGTTSVVAKKLNRCYVGVEKDLDYCLIAEKRLEMAETDKRIQGYKDGVFLSRNAE